MTKLTRYLFIAIMTLMIVSCKKLDKLLDNPNAPSADQADVDLYLNRVQLSFAGVFNSANEFGGQLTRMTVFFGPTYTNGYSPQSFDGIWETAYTGVLKNADAMIPLAKKQQKNFHAGIAEVLKAYTLITLVDQFGDVPYTEAVKGNDNTNPKVEPGKNIYAAALILLDTAIADLTKASSSNPTSILFSPTTKAGWIKVANTLKLKAYITTRLVDPQAGSKIQALLTAGNIITTDADEFTFKFGTQQSTPNARHPRYNEGYYASGGGAADYIGTYYLYDLLFEKGTADPRARYYFYRQTLATPGTQQQQSCAYQSPPAHYPAGTPYCLLPAGYWGRDHGDNSGIPPDGSLRTVWGVYPAGGKFDCSEGTGTTLEQGGRGAGIHPIWMSFFTDFVTAEAALTSTGVTVDPRTALLNGVTKSITRVMNFPTQVGATVCTARTPTATTIANYIAKVMGRYDAATSNNEKLDVVLNEFYLALWGNGIEAYNMYRRSSRPRNLQPAFQPKPDAFIRSFFYPSVNVNLNSSAVQKPNMAVKVFWDTNPDPLF